VYVRLLISDVDSAGGKWSHGPIKGYLAHGT